MPQVCKATANAARTSETSPSSKNRARIAQVRKYVRVGVGGGQYKLNEDDTISYGIGLHAFDDVGMHWHLTTPFAAPFTRQRHYPRRG